MTRRKSTAGNSIETGGSFEVTDTGLRPSWAEFWEVESCRTLSALSAQSGASQPATPKRSTNSTTRTDTVFRQVHFISGSEWQGEWDRLGMNGYGTYRMPHGVVYEGMMNGGEFEGIGILRYPNGGAVEGLWHGGRLKYCQYEYADGLRRDQTPAWPYCKTPDRRFYSEIVQGLKAADTEQLADAEPPVELLSGTYDVGDGIYSPQTKCGTEPISGTILRIPTVAEERWILENCRSTSEETVGFRPELYENWWEDVSLDAVGLPYGADERAILQLILQLGSDLDPVDPVFNRNRRSTLNLTLDHSVLSTALSQSYNEFEDFVRRVVREAGEAKRKSTVKKLPGQHNPSKTMESTEPGEWFESEEEYMRTSSLVKIIQEISQKYLARGKTDTYDSKTNTVTSTTTVEMIKMRTLEIPSQISQSSRNTKPFQVADHGLSLTLSTAPVFTMRWNTADEYDEYEHEGHRHRQDQDLNSKASELMQSKLKYEVDYAEYETDEEGDPAE